MALHVSYSFVIVLYPCARTRGGCIVVSVRNAVFVCDTRRISEHAINYGLILLMGRSDDGVTWGCVVCVSEAAAVRRSRHLIRARDRGSAW